MDSPGPVVDHRPVGGQEVVGVCRTPDDRRGYKRARDGLEQDVE
jgi:hypothetical protein